MEKFTHQELLNGIRYVEYSRLFRRKIAENEEVEARRGAFVLKGILILLISALVMVLGFLFVIHLLSEVLDIDMTARIARIAITAWGLLLFFIFYRIIARTISRFRRVKAIGTNISKPSQPILEYLNRLITETANDSIEDNPRLIEFASVKAAGSMYERREQWRGMLLEEDLFLYQPRTKEIKLVSKSNLNVEVKSKRSEVNHHLMFSNQELKGLNILTQTAYKRLSDFLSA